MSKRAEHIGKFFSEVAVKILENRDKPRKYGTGKTLYPSEINTLTYVGERPGISVTELADLTGVTKGAVSQLLNRLDAKGMIVRREDPANLSRVNVHLTQLGKKAHRGQRAFVRKSRRSLINHLKNLSPGELDILEQFLLAAKNGLS